MSEKDLSISQNSNVLPINKDVVFKRANSFRIKAKVYDFEQYKNTIRAFAAAGMTFNYVANAAEGLGDEVERRETDAPFVEGFQEKLGEVADDDHKILAWQTRGERVSIVPQIVAPTASKKELVSISSGLVNIKAGHEQTIEVLEGIKVVKTDYSELENNPYLMPLPDKIAA